MSKGSRPRARRADRPGYQPAAQDQAPQGRPGGDAVPGPAGAAGAGSGGGEVGGAASGGGGRFLGVDVGTVRVGVAVSDPSGVVATPLVTLDAASLSGRDADTRALARAVAVRLASVAREEACKAVVIGLPRALSGRDTSTTELARGVAAALRDEGMTVELWDERFSSVEAERMLLGAGLRRDRRRQERDAVAATIILQGWLDAHARRVR